MNRDFLSNFERPNPKPETPGQQIGPAEETESTEFANNEYIRNICFVWPDGVRKFISYARLDSGELNADQDTIRLLFGAETVELTGLNLLLLFEAFMEHRRKFVYCDDPRYNDLIDEGPVVNNIVIIQNA